MQRKKNRRNRGSLLGVVVTILLCSLTGCQQRQEPEEALIMVEPEENAVEYSMVVATIGDVSKTRKLKCTYQQTQGQEVSFALSGREIIAVYVKEGEQVSKGQLLAELSSGRLEEQVETLRYQINRNQLLLENAETNENNDISAQWLQYLYRSGQTDGERESLEERVENIQRQYRYTKEDCQDAIALDSRELAALEAEMAQSRVYALMDGTVVECEKDLEGATSAKDEVIMTIMDDDSCLFEVDSTEYASCFTEGQSVSMEITSGTGAGSYQLLPRQMEEWEDVMYFSAEDGDTSAIEVGTTGTMYLTLEERLQVLQIPSKVLHTSAEGTYVYVAGENGLREVRFVETGLYGDDNVEILSGLTEGEKVIE